MFRKIKKLVCFLPLIWACSPSPSEADQVVATDVIQEVSNAAPLQLGAQRLEQYAPLLEGKRLGLVVNHTSTIDSVHLVDSLLARRLEVVRIFAPEHGFRGTADAGATISDGRDVRTGISIKSLYGRQKEPSQKDLSDLDLLIFDIQDVGARFYTYISTLHYIMRAAATAGIPVLVLDRPNPNGHFVDGPILKPAFRSFVGMHEVPVVHGMTVGEYAQLINGEGWLGDGLVADLRVIRCANYTHNTPYELPLPPSPNLPNMRSIYLYPSLCFFEGTVFNVGRGTEQQFQLYGHPDFSPSDTVYTPIPRPGANYPKLQDQRCQGNSLTDLSPSTIRKQGRLDLSYLIAAYQTFPEPAGFFLPSGFFDKLAGTDQLRQQIRAGLSEGEIRASWVDGLRTFRELREKYLLYE